MLFSHPKSSLVHYSHKHFVKSGSFDKKHDSFLEILYLPVKYFHPFHLQRNVECNQFDSWSFTLQYLNYCYHGQFKRRMKTRKRNSGPKSHFRKTSVFRYQPSAAVKRFPWTWTTGLDNQYTPRFSYDRIPEILPL